MDEEGNIELRSEEFQEILGSVPHWILRWGITALAVVVVILLAGSAVFKYPDIIPAPVVLTGSTPPATVVAHASGKLKELYVEDNQNVRKGDYLGVIDNPAQTGDIRRLKWYLDSLDMEQSARLYLPDKNLKTGTLQNLYASFYVSLFNYMEYLRQFYYPQKILLTKERIAQHEIQYESLLRQQTIMNEQFELLHKGYVRDSSLYLKGGVSGKELDNSKSQYLQGLLSQENMQSSLNSLRMQIDQLKESLFDTGYQDTEKGNGLRSQLQSLLSQLKTEIQAWELNYVLSASIDGKVTFTNYWIENQNVVAGSEIFTIVPENDFSIIGKAMLPIARSGKVEAGQSVNIRLENFPENEYGILRGVVQNISLVPVQQGATAYYILEIALPGQLQTTYKKELPYLPNMQGRADIITEDISLLERFILPVKKILKESL
ncbi:MAG: HlyD family secretion protein [Bacteroidales bacterium]|jgi:HlyD family secretion protein|nr:HlyD family secretion protein [Bacteroidales bacterium]